MIERQHVWLGPDATSFAEPCEACLHLRESIATRNLIVEGTLRREADVGFCTCRRGHRIVVRRVGRERVVCPEKRVVILASEKQVGQGRRAPR